MKLLNFQIVLDATFTEFLESVRDIKINAETLIEWAIKKEAMDSKQCRIL